MPEAEVILWSKLRGKGLDGHKFRRQYSIGKFVLDFYCPKLRLAIEVDGDSHMEAIGITFLRFSNREIYKNINGVLNKISGYIKTQESHTPPLSSPWKGEA